MTVTTPQKANLPIIDFSKIVAPNITNSPSSLSAAAAEKQRLFDAFLTVGFVYLKHHNIPDFSIQNLFSHARHFFGLPVSEKSKIETGEKTGFHGWFCPSRTSGNSATSDQKETFDIGNDNDPSKPNQWPEEESCPGLREDMNLFFEKCHEVHLVLLRSLAESVGVKEDFFDDKVEKRHHFCRVLYYPETTRDTFKTRFRATPHTDYGTLTVLVNDDSGGLQVKDTDGKWIDAPPLPGCAIINVGDLLSRWFNDKLKSTEHRVIDPTPKADANGVIPQTLPARYAIAWFGHPNRDCVVEPLDQCCNEETPKKYGPVEAGKHVVERLAYLQKKGRNAAAWSDDMHRANAAGDAAPVAGATANASVVV